MLHAEHRGPEGGDIPSPRYIGPGNLEQAVLDLLVTMGYGGAEKQLRRLGGSGGGGVDGVIDQDPLGLDRVYVRAKRCAADNVVDRETIQAFVRVGVQTRHTYHLIEIDEDFFE